LALRSLGNPCLMKIRLDNDVVNVRLGVCEMGGWRIEVWGQPKKKQEERDVWGGESRWVDNGSVWCADRHVDPKTIPPRSSRIQFSHLDPLHLPSLTIINTHCLLFIYIKLN